MPAVATTPSVGIAQTRTVDHQAVLVDRHQADGEITALVEPTATMAVPALVRMYLPVVAAVERVALLRMPSMAVVVLQVVMVVQVRQGITGGRPPRRR